MELFVTGATGVLGRAVIPHLVGHAAFKWILPKPRLHSFGR